MGFSAVSAVIALATTAVGMVQADAQRRQQVAEQEKSAQIAQQQAQVQEEEARAARREAHDQAQRRRQATAGQAASLRARMAASGAQADKGSALDSLEDTAERGELEALAVEQQGERAALNHQTQAWSLHNQAQSLRDRAGYTAAAGTTEQLTLMGQGMRTGMGFLQRVKGAGRFTA